MLLAPCRDGDWFENLSRSLRCWMLSYLCQLVQAPYSLWLQARDTRLQFAAYISRLRPVNCDPC